MSSPPVAPPGPCAGTPKLLAKRPATSALACRYGSLIERATVSAWSCRPARARLAATGASASHSGRERDFLASEIVRYLGAPGQAISYKLGERAWLAGREAAKAAHAARGESFDLKSWHMAALSLGSLDDLADELAQL